MSISSPYKKLFRDLIHPSPEVSSAKRQGRSEEGSGGLSEKLRIPVAEGLEERHSRV
jgi:hypothetical protein